MTGKVDIAARVPAERRARPRPRRSSTMAPGLRVQVRPSLLRDPRYHHLRDREGLWGTVWELCRAAPGYVRVRWDDGEERDQDGALLTDVDWLGEPPPAIKRIWRIARGLYEAYAGAPLPKPLGPWEGLRPDEQGRWFAAAVAVDEALKPLSKLTAAAGRVVLEMYEKNETTFEAMSALDDAHRAAERALGEGEGGC